MREDREKSRVSDGVRGCPRVFGGVRGVHESGKCPRAGGRGVPVCELHDYDCSLGFLFQTISSGTWIFR